MSEQQPLILKDQFFDHHMYITATKSGIGMFYYGPRGGMVSGFTFDDSAAEALTDWLIARREARKAKE